MTDTTETAIKAVEDFLDWTPRHGYHMTKTVERYVAGAGVTRVQDWADRDEMLSAYIATLHDKEDTG